MQDVLSFEVLTLKELGAIASEACVPRWSRLKKAELIDKLLAAGIVPPTVAELAARRQVEREERLAQAAPIAPPTFDAAERSFSTPETTETTFESPTKNDGALNAAPPTNAIEDVPFAEPAPPAAPLDATPSPVPVDANAAAPESPAPSENSAPAPAAEPDPPHPPSVLSF